MMQSERIDHEADAFRDVKKYAELAQDSCIGNVPEKRYAKEMSIIPVKKGMEKNVSRYVEDQFENAKCEVVIFLIECREQMRRLNVACNCKFAIMGRNGIEFFKG